MTRKIVGAYLLGSNGLRYKVTDSPFPKNVWYEFIKPPNFKGDALTMRADAVFRQYFNETLTRLDVLVIVNSNLYVLDAVKSVVDMGKAYADEIYVVSPAFARVMYAAKESLLSFSDEDQKVVIVTIANEINVTFHILTSASRGSLKLVTSDNCLYPDAAKKLKVITNEYAISQYVFLCADRFIKKTNDLKKGYTSSRLLSYDRWDHMLNEGSLMKANEIIKLPSERSCNLENFSDGIMVEYSKDYKVTLVKPGQPLPLHVSLTEQLSTNITACCHFYSDIVDVFKEMKLISKEATSAIIGQAGKHLRIEVWIDKYGVPKITAQNMTAVDIHKENMNDTCIVSCSLYTGDVKILNSTLEVNKLIKLKFEKVSILSMKDIKKRCQELVKSIPVKYKLKRIVLVQDEEPDEGYLKMLDNRAEKCANIPTLAAKLFYCLTSIESDPGKDVAIITSDLNGLRLYIFTKKSHIFELVHWRPLQQKERICQKSVGMFTTAVGFFNFVNTKRPLTYSPGIAAMLKEFDVNDNLEGEALVKGAMTPFLDRRCRIFWSNFKKQLFSLPTPDVDLKDEFPLFKQGTWPTVTVDFSWETFAVHVFTSEDEVERVADVNHMDNTPLYISFTNSEKPRIGHVAKGDYQKIPKCVVYGIMDMIGLSLENINKKPDWKFSLSSDKDDEVTVSVKFNDSGEQRPFKMEFFLAAFLMAAIKQAKEKAGTNVKNLAILVPPDFEVERFPAVKKAAMMLKLESVEIRQKPQKSSQSTQ